GAAFAGCAKIGAAISVANARAAISAFMIRPPCLTGAAMAARPVFSMEILAQKAVVVLELACCDGDDLALSADARAFGAGSGIVTAAPAPAYAARSSVLRWWGSPRPTRRCRARKSAAHLRHSPARPI